MINPCDDSYNYLFKKFGKEVIEERYSYMQKRVEFFIKKYNLEKKVYLNHGILNVVILDYFADLERLKDFEGIEYANKNKITAFMSYWWIRRKPIQVFPKLEIEESLTYVNEQFITTLIIKDFMFQDNKDILKMDECKKCYEHIFYHLKYRIFTAQTLELMLMAAHTGISIGENK